MAYEFSMLDKAKESFVRKNHWVKDLIKTTDPSIVADLIEARIKDDKLGPILNTFTAKEAPTDLIWALIETENKEEFRAKIASAIGLLLYKIAHNELKQTPELLTGLFNIIYKSKLKECRTRVYSWLSDNMSALVADNHEFKYAYRDGMYAFSQIQPSNDELLELYWRNIFQAGSSFFTGAAFAGLLVQDPKSAIKLLPSLEEKKIEHKAETLRSMWLNENSRHQFERAIKRGLKEGNGSWGRLLNTLLSVLTEDEKGQILVALKNA